MPSTHFNNYLRTHRKRLALTQEEVAFLLGLQSGAKVSRDENYAREPDLAVALAYEAIFNRPIRELFEGLYEAIKEKVGERAKALCYRTGLGKPSRRRDRKIQVLRQLINPQTKRRDENC